MSDNLTDNFDCLLKVLFAVERLFLRDMNYLIYRSTGKAKWTNMKVGLKCTVFEIV